MDGSAWTLAGLCLCLFLCWACVRHHRLGHLRRCGIPGPDPYFLIGNGPDLWRTNVLTVGRWIQRYGRVIAVWDFAPTVVVADLELIRRILVQDFHLFSMRRTILPHGGFAADPEHEVSLISTDMPANRWKEQRSLITTAFTSSRIRDSVPLVNDAIDDLLQNFRDREKEDNIEVYDLFQRFTMDTIGRWCFGIRMDVQKDPNNPLFRATKKFFDDFTKDWRQSLLILALMFPELTMLWYPLRRLESRILRLLGYPNHWTYQMDMCRNIVALRKANIRDPNNPYSRDDLLQRMIEATLTSEQMMSLQESNLTASDYIDDKETLIRNARAKAGVKVHRMDDKEVAANASIFFDAGYETTSTLLAFLSHVLVNKPAIQERIRSEVQSLYERDRNLDYNTVNELPFLDSVIFETLRLFPPITGAVTRQSSADYKWKGMTIPANTAICIPLYFLQRDPDVWQDAETFDPMRFYGANKSRASSPSFQAFGFGPRNCIGLRFALMEAKLVVARLLLQYYLVPGCKTADFDRLEIHYKPITQNPGRGVFVRLIPVT